MPERTIRLTRARLDTPLGSMLAMASPTGLCALEFGAPERATRLHARLARYLPGHESVDGEAEHLTVVRAWLAAYFAGTLAPGAVVRLHLLGTDFERAVWDALTAIPAGATVTYGAIARQLGRPDAARAVGAAVGANPVSILVPCHRVIGTSGGLIGYGGGLPRKEWLLRHEGSLLL